MLPRDACLARRRRRRREIVEREREIMISSCMILSCYRESRNEENNVLKEVVVNLINILRVTSPNL